MVNAKAIDTPMPSYVRLNKDMCPKAQEEEEKMSKVPYASTIGSLLYAMVCMRPNTAHAIGVVSKYMINLEVEHWNVVKWILEYLRGTYNKCLCFGGSNTNLRGYVESCLVGDIDTRRSTTGYAFIVGGIVVSWIS